jgi:hypothetical protein
MRKLLVRAAIVGIVLVAWSSVDSGDPAARRSVSMLVPTPAGASMNRVEVSEPAGVIRLFRVVAPAGTHLSVTGRVSGLAVVSISLPLVNHDPSETCARHGRSVVCSQSEEACPMPPATWQFRLRKLAGPAGRIRIDFVVGSEHSARAPHLHERAHHETAGPNHRAYAAFPLSGTTISAKPPLPGRHSPT